MHGRLKIKTTAEQQEEKRKEREEKRKMYLKLFNHANEMNRSSNFQEFMKSSAQVLAANPDLSTFWNHRRKWILSLKEDLEDNFQNELDLTKNCLMKNPKSYCAWHHRSWILTRHPSPPWEKERQLCDDYLKLDERNFHCWDHRRFVVKGSKRKAEEELVVSKNLIEHNLSNYSAWHYRSKLLPVVHPPALSTPHPLNEQELVKELKMVVEAVFTDPSDQSPWFFLRWLINKHHGAARITEVSLNVNGSCARLVCIYSKEVESSSIPDVILNGITQSLNWNSPQQQKHSCIWTTSILLNEESNEHCVVVKLKDDSILCTLDVPSGQNQIYRKIIDTNTNSLSELAKNTLIEIKDNCIALDELEPDNKWVLLTLVDVLWALNYIDHKDQIINYLDQLENLDPLRHNYYKDMRSKLLIKIGITDVLVDDSNFNVNLSSRSITRIYDAHHLASVSSVDFRDNVLSSIGPLSQLISCIELKLDGNKDLSDVSPVASLKSLRKLSLSNCGIESESTLLKLSSLDKLETLNIENNLVCSNEISVETIKKAFSHVKILSI